MKEEKEEKEEQGKGTQAKWRMTRLQDKRTCDQNTYKNDEENVGKKRGGRRKKRTERKKRNAILIHRTDARGQRETWQGNRRN